MLHFKTVSMLEALTRLHYIERRLDIYFNMINLYRHKQQAYYTFTNIDISMINYLYKVVARLQKEQIYLKLLLDNS